LTKALQPNLVTYSHPLEFIVCTHSSGKTTLSRSSRDLPYSAVKKDPIFRSIGCTFRDEL